MDTAALAPRIRTRQMPLQTLGTSRDFIASPGRDFEHLIAEVWQFTMLPENWDLHGGSAVTSQAAIASLEVLSIGLEFGLHPDVMALGDGGLLAEWHHGDTLLQIEWSQDGLGEFNIAIAHELVIEDALPREPSVLFAHILDRSLLR